MAQSLETNLALFIDFDNVAIGARDARKRFEMQLVLQRLLEKGKIIVKRAYADWAHHKEYLTDLHQAGIELIEIPAPQLSGKNSADIRLVVDAMDLCYGKEHLDTFVIVSGDSDFTPLVSKLRENGKSVIGVGMRNSSSHLLIVNCDEFIFYDDLFHENVTQKVEGLAQLPAQKRKLFDFLVQTIQGLMRETRGVLYSSLIKDTMKRKQPEFNERNYGYSNFGDLLEEAMEQGLLEAERDSRAGGTWVVSNLGKGVQRAGGARRAADGRGASRRRTGRDRRGEAAGDVPAAAPERAGDVPSAAPERVGGEPTPETTSTRLGPGARPAPPADAPSRPGIVEVPATDTAQSLEPAAVTASAEIAIRPLPGPDGPPSRRSRGRRRGRRKEGTAREEAGEPTGAPRTDSGIPAMGASRAGAPAESAGEAPPHPESIAAPGGEAPAAGRPRRGPGTRRGKAGPKAATAKAAGAASGNEAAAPAKAGSRPAGRSAKKATRRPASRGSPKKGGPGEGGAAGGGSPGPAPAA